MENHRDWVRRVATQHHHTLVCVFFVLHWHFLYNLYVLYRLLLKLKHPKLVAFRIIALLLAKRNKTTSSSQELMFHFNPYQQVALLASVASKSSKWGLSSEWALLGWSCSGGTWSCDGALSRFPLHVYGVNLWLNNSSQSFHRGGEHAWAVSCHCLLHFCCLRGIRGDSL